MPTDTTLYRPANGWFGDVMPIYVDGRFHIFYTILHGDDLGGPGVLKGLDWAHISTDDFLTFEEHPLAIVRGDSKAADLLVGAGSVVEAPDGTFVAFYGGINPARSSWGAAEQVVLRATSEDLETWTKDDGFEFEADPSWYERHDWRDPCLSDGTSGGCSCARQMAVRSPLGRPGHVSDLTWAQSGRCNQESRARVRGGGRPGRPHTSSTDSIFGRGTSSTG